MIQTKDQLEPKIGEGIYTIPEAAQILNLSSAKVRRWVNKYWEYDFLNNQDNISSYTWGESREKGFNFYTLIEIIAVHTFREIGVSFQKIKLAHELLRDILETIYPFSTSQLMTDGISIFYKYDEAALLNLDKSMQTSFKRIIEPYCKKIDFDEKNYLARRYWPLGKERHIVVDPHHSFGQPTIAGTNITVDSLLTLLRAGENKADIASLYEIPEEQVEDVVLFQQRLAA